MGKIRFVVPDTVTLQLPDGDWIEIKKTLNVGERRSIIQRAQAGFGTNGERYHVDMVARSFAFVEAYLVDWSFVGLDGKKVVDISTPVQKAAALRIMDAESFSELETVINAHEDAQEAAKNASASAVSGSSIPASGASDSAASLASVSSSDGPTPT